MRSESLLDTSLYNILRRNSYKLSGEAEFTVVCTRCTAVGSACSLYAVGTVRKRVHHPVLCRVAARASLWPQCTESVHRPPPTARPRPRGVQPPAQGAQGLYLYSYLHLGTQNKIRTRHQRSQFKLELELEQRSCLPSHTQPSLNRSRVLLQKPRVLIRLRVCAF